MLSTNPTGMAPPRFFVSLPVEADKFSFYKIPKAVEKYHQSITPTLSVPPLLCTNKTRIHITITEQLLLPFRLLLLLLDEHDLVLKRPSRVATFPSTLRAPCTHTDTHALTYARPLLIQSKNSWATSHFLADSEAYSRGHTITCFRIYTSSQCKWVGGSVKQNPWTGFLFTRSVRDLVKHNISTLAHTYFHIFNAFGPGPTGGETIN